MNNYQKMGAIMLSFDRPNRKYLSKKCSCEDAFDNSIFYFIRVTSFFRILKQQQGYFFWFTNQVL
jgi:hypothetical protein